MTTLAEHTGLDAQELRALVYPLLGATVVRDLDGVKDCMVEIVTSGTDVQAPARLFAAAVCLASMAAQTKVRPQMNLARRLVLNHQDTEASHAAWAARTTQDHLAALMDLAVVVVSGQTQ